MRRGFTLVELLGVIGIVCVLIVAVVASVSTMTRDSRLHRAATVALAAVDEVRTAAMAYHRTAQLDLALNADGTARQFTAPGRVWTDDFEHYAEADRSSAAEAWLSTGTPPSLVTDSSHCLKLAGQGLTYFWNPDSTAGQASSETHLLLQGRIKFLPTTDRERSSICLMLGDQAADRLIRPAYLLELYFAHGTVMETGLEIRRVDGGEITDGPATLVIDRDRADALIRPQTWYHLQLSFKREGAQAVLAAKIWAPGDAEPSAWALGPVRDRSALAVTCGGVAIRGTAALLDDVVLEQRAFRVLPAGVRLSLFANDGTTPAGFPVLFRSNGQPTGQFALHLDDGRGGRGQWLNLTRTATADTGYGQRATPATTADPAPPGVAQ